ncbi:MAG: aminomethyltransferase family protein [bacterium]|nr:aminomethyltransferase family protein [bacterium]
MTATDGERTIMGTAFYPRTSVLNERQKWNAWDRYHIVDAYTEWQEEVRTIREQASALDQSPLSKHYISGPDAARLVDYLITRDATKIEVGQIYYSPWCNQDGAMVGDGLVARIAPDRFMFTADPMMNWFRYNAEGYDVTIEDVTFDFGLLALQGPASTAVIEAATGQSWSDLRFSRLRTATVGGVEVIVFRQGFTGEIGYEFFVPTGDGVDVWDTLFDAGAPLGLGAGGLHAVDVARIEAGMVIVGTDYTPAAMDRLGDPLKVSPENMTTPLELNLHRFVDFDESADFVGKKALRRELEAGPKRSMVGIEVDWRAVVGLYQDLDIPPEVTPQVIRYPLPIYQDGSRIGRATSVTWSPTVEKVIGFAHVAADHAGAGTPVRVDWRAGEIHGEVGATLVALPHYRLRRAG